MKSAVLSVCAIVATGVAAGADLPAGVNVQITEAGTYTASADRTIDSLVVATPTGAADAHTVTVFDHTSCPERSITVNGANPQFNVANHYNDVWFKGGVWNFSSYFYLGNENSSTDGKDTFRRMYVTDGAALSGATRMYVNYGNGGNELYVSNATFSAGDMYVQTGSAVTSSYDTSNRGKLIVNKDGKVTLSGTLYVQGEYTSSNSRQTGAAYVSGTDAEVSATNIELGNAPQTRARCGSEMIVTDGGKVSSSGDIRIGMKPYVHNPALFDVFKVVDGTLSAETFTAGYGENVVNEQAILSNSTVVVNNVFYCGSGANSASNTVVVKDCTDLVEIKKTLYVGSGNGAHDNFIGFYNCGTIQLTDTLSWYAGRGDGSYGNTLMVSNTVLRTNREVAAGSTSTSVSNEVVVAGPLGRVEMTLKQRDPIYYGRCNRFRVTDNATLSAEDSSIWLFKTGYDSEVVIENGGVLTNGLGQSLSIIVGKVTSSGVRSGNSLIVRDEGKGYVTGELQVNGTNNALVVSDGSVRVDLHFSVGVAQKRDVDGDTPSEGCRLVVAGTHPKVDIGKNLSFVDGAKCVLRFVLSGNGYSWPDEPTRAAPVVLTASGTYTMTVNDDTVLEADVSKLDPSARGNPIALVVSPKAISMSETALAAANAKGAAAKKPYRFSLSADKTTLYLTAESRGILLTIR